jgi:hypothetical protein
VGGIEFGIEDTFSGTTQFWFVTVDAQFLSNVILVDFEPSPYQSRSPDGPENQKNQKIGVNYSFHSADSIGTYLKVKIGISIQKTKQKVKNKKLKIKYLACFFDQ